VLPFADSCLTCNDSGIVRQVDGQINRPCMAFSTSPLLFPYLESTRTLVVPFSVVSTQRKQIKAKPNLAHRQTVPRW
jgi:hypothetical protein